MRLIQILLLITLLTFAAHPLAAQADLRARMEAFLREVEERPNTGLVAYFPRRGDWTWVQTLRDERGEDSRTGIWRFPGAETGRAIGKGGPVCDSFDEGGHYTPWEGRLGMHAMLNRGPWRRVRGNRFVPRGADASSRWFVEWRREDGQWVVSAFGDEDFRFTFPPPEPPRGPFAPDTTQVAEDTAFAPAEWYMITIDGERHPKYGLPRALDRAALVRIGHLYGVNVYVGRGWEDGFLYLPVAAGQFQPYERWAPVPCE